MQKFIVKITSENISLIDDSRVECFLLDSAADTAFNRRFAEAARKAGKLLLSCGDKAPELCRELGLDGVVVDLSKNEKPKAEFQFLRNFLGKDAVIGAVTATRRWLSASSSRTFLSFRPGMTELNRCASWFPGITGSF